MPSGKVSIRAAIYISIRNRCRVLPFGKVSYRMPLYLNSTSISLDVLLTISPPHAIMVSQGKEGKHNVCKDELEGSRKKFNAHEDLAKLEASYRYYKVVEIEEREV